MPSNTTVSGVPNPAGTTTNDNAVAGTVGELITSSIPTASPVTLSNNTTADITSISLTPGDWDVSGQVNYILTGVTATLFQSGISMSSATLPAQAGGSGLGTDPLVGVPLITTVLTSTYSQNIAPVRVSIATNTTIYLVGRATFSVGTHTACGTLRARRKR